MDEAKTIETAAHALYDAVGRHGPWDDHDVSAAWCAASMADPPSLRRLYDAVLKTDRATWAPEVLAAMRGIERALRTTEVEYAHALAAPALHPTYPMRFVAAPEAPPPARAEMGRELRKLIADARQGPDAFVADLSTGTVTPVPAPWQVGDPCEVRYEGAGGWPWSPATVREVGVGGRVRVVFDAPSPDRHPSWWASPQNVRRPLADRVSRHEDPPSAPEAPPPADARAFPATCLLCGAPAYHGAISAERSRGARCGIADPLPEPAKVWRKLVARGPEMGWRAEGGGLSADHPTREGAIAAWRAKVDSALYGIGLAVVGPTARPAAIAQAGRDIADAMGSAIEAVAGFYESAEAFAAAVDREVAKATRGAP